MTAATIGQDRNQDGSVLVTPSPTHPQVPRDRPILTHVGETESPWETPQQWVKSSRKAYRARRGLGGPRERPRSRDRRSGTGDSKLRPQQGPGQQ